MKTRVCKREFNIILLLLVVSVLIILLQNMKFRHAVTTIAALRVSINLTKNHSFFAFQPLSTEDSVEERLLLDSIAWPETPLLPGPVSLENTSDPAHSTFTILPRRGGQWHVGDQLEVMIEMCDFQGSPKRYGGDLLLARLHNPKLGAGVAGQVVDHLNGSYSAVFSLLWEGDAQVEVMLVHPSEAIAVLCRLTKEQPDRIYFRSLFRSGSRSESSICNVRLHPTQPLCNYTDLRTGEPWFCYKPKNLSCDARINHMMGGYKQNIKANEDKLFNNGANMKVFIQSSAPANVTVLPKNEVFSSREMYRGQFEKSPRSMEHWMKGQPEVKSSYLTPGPSGYYYQGVWRALGGPTVHQFNNPPAISQCLKGKVVHMYGDSTIRQFFEYLTRALPDLKEFDLHSPRQVGPFMALNYANNIMVTFRCHGPPIRFGKVHTSELRYIANELDDITGGTNTVVVLGIWSHFSTFPMEVYIQRLQNIRKAVVRLLDRAPGTVVIIRTGNPKALTLYETITNSDWYTLQRDKVLRATFKGLNVHLIDAWEMVLAHHLPHSLHPQPPIIKNMINVILSHICP
ncbi:NXPE family member 3-like isoform X2 [Epinephelus fuscoguttatus]|uniref:NXPE family member 3-like isoform X2 n=1 Tax=Epinephelus fuscoguttatus TaxID=293821 RepID=UPI0020CFEE07|nr:NXPE family member 3-like isoform X2 [Epinephelus fuscoguttatus]